MEGTACRRKRYRVLSCTAACWRSHTTRTPTNCLSRIATHITVRAHTPSARCCDLYCRYYSLVAERLCEKRRVVFSLQLVLWDQFAKFEEMAANKILSLAGCAVEHITM